MFVGLYFGSFNPIHNGHLSIAKQMLERVGFDAIWFVVSPLNPLKVGVKLAPNADRMRMVELAIESQNLPFKASDVEFGLPIPSYTVDTLVKLEVLYPSIRFGIVMGSDNVASIEQWKDYKKILLNYPVYFFPRKGDDSEMLAKRYNIQLVDAGYLDISSTEIRNLLASGASIEGLVADNVGEYIHAQHLYL